LKTLYKAKRESLKPHSAVAFFLRLLEDMPDASFAGQQEIFFKTLKGYDAQS